MKWRVVHLWHTYGSETWFDPGQGYIYNEPVHVTVSQPTVFLWEANYPGHWAVVTSDKTTLYFDDKDAAMVAVLHLKENWL